MQGPELLSPAFDAEAGIAAINYGADAVYIGAPEFSARKAANSNIAAIERLVKYAHAYRAKVYVALNTILTDEEIKRACGIAWQCYEAGVDALIIQDMGLLEMDLPPIPLFASTQTTPLTWEKVQFLEKVGFQRVILGRELSLDEIKEIRSHTAVDLEFFVHGALCVSYSGQCYLSYVSGGRSGNRGECAQPCRLPYSLLDSRGKAILRNRHLLSLKDLNLAASLAQLADAGISSFKIEGRLKDIDYVKNITAFYRQQLDRLFAQRGWKKPSSGQVQFHFQPDPEKSFNRGFSSYFLYERQRGIASLDTPKSIGKKIGKVKEVKKEYFLADLAETVSNGDGLCFFDEQGRLQGMRINRAEGNKLFPARWVALSPGTVLYRNADHAFEKMLRQDKTSRKVQVDFLLRESGENILLEATDEDSYHVEVSAPCKKESPRAGETSFQIIHEALSRTGHTMFAPRSIRICHGTQAFLPVSLINHLRREALSKLQSLRLSSYLRHEVKITPNDFPYPAAKIDYSANVMNHYAENFYRRHGVKDIEPALERQHEFSGKAVMTMRYCLLYELGYCKKKKKLLFHEPLFLSDGRHTYRLEFDCHRCVMKVVYL